ncbi:outer membrane beta-barrel family protein [Acetobacteroides hydrogenigenes]|uniref:Outer membrane receptor protein involved in Fe transport n=1 Tax=Acetobacteroides hydrogenigenes TaxID=979970 RepID=A0A4V6NLV5_9BACT|nr:outer membrane beta-barrel family protein [Acetobacteroides hydrogenigenes]TCN64710.1 outer membrane receptor protein involved in Fe transport [Acetobacteroides hydrogenigenes]
MSSNTFKIVILAFILGSALSSAAQQRSGGSGASHGANPAGSLKLTKITGTVIDKSTSKPVEYANIAIYRAKDSTLVTGGISDNAGKFSIDRIPYGIYTLKVKFIGYSTSVVKDVKANQPTTDVGKIDINPSSKNIEEVTVVGRKNEVQNNLDKKVYNIDRSMYGTGGTALDIMQSLPAVAVDFDGNVSMRGSSVTILIDGRPSNLVSLDQMPAHLIQRVEIISNPSAKYDPEGMSGIINIILKKNIQRGLNGMVNLNAGYNNKWMGSATLNYRKNKVNFFTNYTLRSFNGESYQDSWSNSTFNGTNTFQQRNTTTDNKMRMQNIQAGIDYYLNDKNTLNTSFTLEPRSMRSNDEATGYTNSNGVKMYDYNRYTKNKGSNKGGFEYDLAYKRTFAREGEELTAEFNIDRGNNEMEQTSIEQNTKTPENNFTKPLTPYTHQLTNSNNDNVRTMFRTDYVLPLAEMGRVEVGYMLSNSLSKSTYDLSKAYAENTAPVLQPQYTNDFDYRQTVNAVYANYGISIGKFKAQAGLRAENADTHGEQKTENTSFRKNFFDFFPSAFVKYAPNDNNEFGINYSRRTNRPRMWSLNPFVNRADTLNTSQGNPDLDPEYINSFEVGYTRIFNKNSVSLTAFYRKTTGIVATIRQQVDALRSFTTFVNLNSGESYGAEAAANINIFKWWNTNWSYSYFHTKLTDNSSVLDNKTKDSDSWTLRATSNWFLSKQFSLQAMYNYRSPVVTTGAGGFRGMGGASQGKSHASYTVDMGARYSILKGKGDVSLRVSDIFDTGRYITDGFGPNYTSYSKSWRQTPNVFLGFTYRINDFKRKPQKQQDQNSMDEEMM